jgi:hypothetical protein
MAKNWLDMVTELSAEVKVLRGARRDERVLSHGKGGLGTGSAR